MANTVKTVKKLKNADRTATLEVLVDVPEPGRWRVALEWKRPKQGVTRRGMVTTHRTKASAARTVKALVKDAERRQWQTA
jgi:hypothetical protein